MLIGCGIAALAIFGFAVGLADDAGFATSFTRRIRRGYGG